MSMGKTSKRQKTKPEYSMDRISQLPEPIQHNILSLLEEKAVARTQVLSKAWRIIVHSRPVLEFDLRHFRKEPKLTAQLNSGHYDMIRSQERIIFINYVNESMRRLVERGLTLQRFSLRTKLSFTDTWDMWAPNINHWIQQSVVQAKVKDLALVFDGPCMLPPFVFLSATITRLTLERCNVEECSNVSLPNVLDLTLSHVALTHDMIEEFESGCPKLEVLKLYRCKGLTSIRVSGLDMLTEVDLILCDSVSRVKVVAPKLRVFKVLLDFYHDNHVIKIDLVACESSLRKLSFSCINLTDEWLGSFVSKFLELESLALYDSRDLKNIKIPNQKLRKLKVSLLRNLEKIDTGAINLRALAFRFNKLPFYPLNSSFTLDDTASFFASFPIDGMFQSWSCSFKELLFEFNWLGNLKVIVISDRKDVIVYEELDGSFIDMLHRLKDEYDQILHSDDDDDGNMIVEVIRTTSYEYTIDYLFEYFCFWFISYGHMKTLSIVSRKERNNKKVVEVLSENTLKENEEPNCCVDDSYKCHRHLLSKKTTRTTEIDERSEFCGCRLRFKCWRHRLYDVEMIGDDMAESSIWFESFDTIEYDITRINLEWLT